MNLLAVMLASMMAMASPHPHAMMTHGHAMKTSSKMHKSAMHSAMHKKNAMHKKSAMHAKKNTMHKKNAMMKGHHMAKPTPKP